MGEVRLTKAQRSLLMRMIGVQDERDLVNCDECLPSWWIDGGFAVNANTAAALSRAKYIEIFRHEGGRPGVDRYRLTPAGRLALSAREQSK